MFVPINYISDLETWLNSVNISYMYEDNYNIIKCKIHDVDGTPYVVIFDFERAGFICFDVSSEEIKRQPAFAVSYGNSEEKLFEASKKVAKWFKENTFYYYMPIYTPGYEDFMMSSVDKFRFQNQKKLEAERTIKKIVDVFNKISKIVHIETFYNNVEEYLTDNSDKSYNDREILGILIDEAHPIIFFEKTPEKTFNYSVEMYDHQPIFKEKGENVEFTDLLYVLNRIIVENGNKAKNTIYEAKMNEIAEILKNLVC